MSGTIQLYPCNVECVSSSKYGERPTAVVFEHERILITNILKRWRSPEGTNFQVLTDNNLAFELTYHEATDKWSFKSI
jgi:hypothetical protein